jgi:hypothetical protein
MMSSSHRIGIIVGALLASACYDYVPVETAPPPGGRVAIEISDRGRVALTDRFGPGLVEIEGMLVASEGNDYVLNVARVAQIGGASTAWSGEETRVSRDFVGTVRERQLSKWRTGLLAAGIIGGVAALASRGLNGSLSESSQQSTPPTPISIRIPIHW